MSETILSNTFIANASKEYKQRRRSQMIRFYAATAATLVVSRIVHKGIKSRNYIPNLFQANHMPPPYSQRQEAIAAIGFGSLLATGGFSMVVFGAAWIYDISTFSDFGDRMKEWLGGKENMEQIAKLDEDPESQKVENSLSDLLGKK